MAGVSTSHLILFIASLIVAASVAGTFTTEVERISGALGDRSLDVSKQIKTDVEVISDADSGNVYNSSKKENITVLVKNTGSLDLAGDPREVDVIVDGEYQTDLSVSVIDEDTWKRGAVAKIEINKSLSPGDHRVLIVVNDDEEVFEFRT